MHAQGGLCRGCGHRAAGPTVAARRRGGDGFLNTYPKASRDWLSIPEPGEWARMNLTRLLDGADLMLVMSHAGWPVTVTFCPSCPTGP